LREVHFRAMRVNHFGEVGALKAEVDIQWHFLFFE
jgi:hypothetical protein